MPSFIKRYAVITSIFIASISLSHHALAESKPAYPQAIQSLIEQGVIITDVFAGPSDLQVYTATYQDQDIALYLTDDKKHVLVGQLFDDKANNLTSELLEEKVIGPRNALTWEKLAKTAWIQDGKKDAPIVLYAFMDPNCPYCHRFREQADPWVKAGKVQIRHIVVGILGQSSFDKAAAINGGKDRTAAFLDNQYKFEKGGIKPDQQSLLRGTKITDTNNEFMRDIGITGAPAIFFKRNGKVELARGLPQGQAFEYMMGE